MAFPKLRNLLPRTGQIVNSLDEVVNIADGYNSTLGTSAVSDLWMAEKIKGNVFTSDHIFNSVADEGFADYVIQAPVDSDLIVRALVVVFGKATVNSYAGSTFSSLGTSANPWNRLAGFRPATAGIYYDPTIDTLGDKRLEQLIPSGTTGATRLGAESADTLDSIIPRGSLVHVRTQNNSGAIMEQLQFTLHFIEKDLGL